MMRFRNWMVGAIAASVAASLAWTAATPNRQALLEKRQALLRRLEKMRRKNMNVPPSDGKFLKLMAESINAKRVLEIGSSNGYSAIWIGWGLEQTGGHLWTIEIDPARAKECRENIKEAGLEKVVTSIEGDAFEVIPKLEGPFDLVFVDAWKEDYDDFFKIFFPKLEKGGVILAHNAVAFASRMKDYLDIVNNHPELDTVIVRTDGQRDGFAVTFRKRKK